MQGLSQSHSFPSQAHSQRCSQTLPRSLEPFLERSWEASGTLRDPLGVSGSLWGTVPGTVLGSLRPGRLRDPPGVSGTLRESRGVSGELFPERSWEASGILRVPPGVSETLRRTIPGTVLGSLRESPGPSGTLQEPPGPSGEPFPEWLEEASGNLWELPGLLREWFREGLGCFMGRVRDYQRTILIMYILLSFFDSSASQTVTPEDLAV